MTRPLQLYVFTHDAILHEVADIEERAKELNRDDSAAITEFAEHLSWFHTVVASHERAEEEVLFPAMNDRHEFIAEAYFFDHDDFEKHVWAGIDSAIAGLTGAGNGARKEDAMRLYRESVALHEHMRLHIAKENELLLPKLETEFDISEQAEMVGAMAALGNPQLLGQGVGWMYKWQTAQQREEMVRYLHTNLPAEAFAGISGILAGINADDWAEVQRRIPELA